MTSNKFNDLVKSRHSREGGNPLKVELLEKNGFPIKDFGNDGIREDFYEIAKFDDMRICETRYLSLVTDYRCPE